MIATTIAATSSTEQEVKVLQEAASALPLDSETRKALQLLLNSVLNGTNATVIEEGSDLTPNEAAKILGMSRPHLLTFLDSGNLPFHRVGTHRRIKLDDLVAFAERRDRASKFVTEAIASTTQPQPRRPLSAAARQQLAKLAD